tara:strand:+ start:437 stop:925 length:489 start_codon:yes stop_codon:yes gene_type:complete
MKILKIFILSFSIICTVNSSISAQDYISLSVGQFDINDSEDTAELRLEYLYGHNIYDNHFNLKPFVGIMMNRNSAKYLFSGLRKDFSLSPNLNFTPSLAAGYYDRGRSKDLGHNIEFRSQLEFSYKTDQGRVGINVNHISNASIGDKNPGTESITITLMRPF